MKKNTAFIVITLVAWLTVAMTFFQPTVIHQLVIWVGGLFFLMLTLVTFVVSNWPVADKESDKLTGDRYLIKMAHRYRLMGYSDDNIADALNTDIDVIKAIPR